MKKELNIKLLSDWLETGRLLLEKKPQEPVSSLYAITSAVLGKPKSWVLAHQDALLEPAQTDMLFGMIADLIEGKPLAYILGQQSFFGMDFYVTPDTLIPRPETELLVENAIKWLKGQKKETNICDIGTGSGCIAISIAKAVKNTRVIALDNSWKSILVARENSQNHNLSHRIALLVSDLVKCIDFKFDLICANLPYIPTSTLNKLNCLRFEPKSALDGGEDGLVQISRLINQIKNKMNTPGLILIEFESGQSTQIEHLLRINIPNQSHKIIYDYGDHPRLAYIAF